VDGYSLQVLRAAANTLTNQSRKLTRGNSTAMELGVGATNTNIQKKQTLYRLSDPSWSDNPYGR
jgi:hypothetical protein